MSSKKSIHITENDDGTFQASVDWQDKKGGYQSKSYSADSIESVLAKIGKMKSEKPEKSEKDEEPKEATKKGRDKTMAGLFK